MPSRQGSSAACQPWECPSDTQIFPWFPCLCTLGWVNKQFPHVWDIQELWQAADGLFQLQSASAPSNTSNNRRNKQKEFSLLTKKCSLLNSSCAPRQPPVTPVRGRESLETRAARIPCREFHARVPLAWNASHSGSALCQLTQPEQKCVYLCVQSEINPTGNPKYKCHPEFLLVFLNFSP